MHSVDELAPVAVDVLSVAAEQSTDRAVVLTLSGELGAGKTTFMQEIARQLGVTEHVTSPTFVIMKGYDLIDQPFDQLVHIDAYRIETSEELAVLGFAELLQQPRTLICIEWAERVSDLLPPDALALAFATEGETRLITFNHG